MFSDDHPVDLYGLHPYPATTQALNTETVPSAASHLAESSIGENSPLAEVLEMKRLAAKSKPQAVIFDHDFSPFKRGIPNP